MKKTVKIFKILTILILILLILQTTVKAKEILDEGEEILTEGLWGWYLQDDDATMDIDITLGNSGAQSSSKQMTERLLGWIQLIGSIISVIALLILGFRYMFSSVDEKAQLKGVLIYYIVGAVLVFATSNLLSVAYNVIKGLSL